MYYIYIYIYIRQFHKFNTIAIKSRLRYFCTDYEYETTLINL